VRTGDDLGIREGHAGWMVDYVLTLEDTQAGVEFPDVIARALWNDRIRAV
jgi:hypothetical protein